MSIHNFSAGPAAIPQSVLLQLQSELCDFNGSGYSLLSTSHRSGLYEEIHHRAINGIRAVLRVPKTHSILLLGGGASLQFGMIPMNFAMEKAVGIALTGKWAEKAYSDLKQIANPFVLWKRSTDEEFPKSLTHSKPLHYVHLTSNETIDGVQWQTLPDCNNVDIVVDASSDLGSRNIDITRCAVVYAGAQKNLGVAGVTIVIIRNDLFEGIPDTIPSYLNFATHQKTNSLYNTPPVFAIRVLDLVLQWIEAQGGLDAIEQYNATKAHMIYETLDAHPETYTTVRNNRSRINIVWSLQTDAANEIFLLRAEEAGCIGLRGHRSTGGIRASLYNAVSSESVRILAECIQDFATQGELKELPD